MVPISPEIYSSTAVVMDNRSLADYIQRLEDRRLKRAAAEQEAFDAWNEANEKSLNPSKMRNQELGKFNEGLQEYRALAIEAKRNPKDYTKRLTAQKKADELLALARASSNAKEIDKEYTTLLRNTLNNPEARKTTDYQRILQDKSIHDLPIGFRAGGFMGIPEMRRPEDTAPKMDYYKPPPIDVVKLFDKNSSGVKLGAGVRTSPTDKDFFYTETATYTPEGIKSIAERVADKVANDPNLLSSYRVKGQQLTPDQAADMTAKLKKYFPNMEVDDDNPISVALADIVIEGERRKEEKKVRDVGAYARYQSGLIEGRAQRRLNLLQSGNVIDNFPDTPISRGTQPTGSIQGGVVYDNNGNLYNGEFRAAYEKLPADLPAVLSFAKIKLNKKPFTVEVKDGVIQSIKQDGGLKIGRQIIENAQRKFGKGMEFGPQGQQGFTDDPLGILD